MISPKDTKAFFVLAVILSMGFGLFLVFNYDRSIQILITISLGVAYVFWGVIHHILRKDFHWRVVLEYIAVALMACVLAGFLIASA